MVAVALILGPHEVAQRINLVLIEHAYGNPRQGLFISDDAAGNPIVVRETSMIMKGTSWGAGITFSMLGGGYPGHGGC